MIFTTVYLDLTMSTLKNIKCSLGDNNTKEFIIVLTNNGKVYNIANGTKVYLKIKRPNNTYMYVDEDEDYLFRSGNTIHLTMVDALTKVSGVSICELQLIQNGNVISSCKFNLVVDKSAIAEGVIESTNEFTALSELMAKFSNIDLDDDGNISFSISGDIELAKQYMEQSRNYSNLSQDYYNRTSALANELNSSSGGSSSDATLEDSDFETENISFYSLLS